MKLAFFLALVLTGCSHNRVTVDYDSCVMRGEVDSIKVAECHRVELK